ncbi:MAG: hypothetical protein M3203_00140 [Actinomycetota bacterium]|nr:hypothetical protein [Actinomycetota bacterium]
MRPRLLRILLLVDLVVLSGGLFLVAGRYWSSDVDLEEARTRFRESRAPTEAHPGLPAPGVYQYRTTGGEWVSLFDTYRAYSPTTMRIVTRHGCGVREEQFFVTQHLEYYDRCGDRLVAYGTDIAYWWVHGTQDFVCEGGSFDMAGRRPGDRVEWDCADEDTRARQITEYVGDETVEVEGVHLPARRTRWTTIFSGATVGGAVVDDWFDPSTGLLLRERRDIVLQVGSQFVGRLDYIDRSDYTLLSVTPAR